MRVPFEWIKEFVDIKDSADEVAYKLTMIGLEVEAMEEVDEDVVFEVNVTPNRADCLSILGIARELSAIYKRDLRFPAHSVATEIGELDFNVDILDTELCHRYAGRIIRNIKIGPSPEWLKNRLKKCNLRSVNNVVDITNYVLLELGHPLHAFDLKTIKGHRILVGTPKKVCSQQGVRSKEKTKLITLDGIEREIPEDCLLIWDSERPIAIAGIIGGLDTEVSDYTVDIFIESAYFDPISVRRTSKALGIKTESSYRFERGVDIKMLKKALDRAAYLMKEVADGEIYGKLDIYPKRYVPQKITVRDRRINKMLGLRLSRSEILSYLSGLGLKIEEALDSFTVEPPIYRGDLKRESDIIEEVARFYGYDRIPAELPKATLAIENHDELKAKSIEVKNNIKQALLKSGFTEAINYSFMGLKDLDMLQIEAQDERRRLVKIKNPLRLEDSFMRTTIIPALIKNLHYNVSHGIKELRLFEIGRVFINQKDGSLPIERNHLAAIYYKEKIKTLYKDETPDFYIVKGVIEAILNDLKIYDYSFVRSSEPFLHPGQSADIFINNNVADEQSSSVAKYTKKTYMQCPTTANKIGYIGALSPAIIDSLDIKAHKPSIIIILEINIDNLMPYAMQVAKYRSIPKYPFVERDTAIIVDEIVDSGALMGLLKSYDSDFIEDMYIFDVYKGKSIPEGKKSIAFTVRYRASDKTLKDEEVDALHKELIDYIVDKLDAKVRQ